MSAVAKTGRSLLRTYLASLLHELVTAFFRLSWKVLDITSSKNLLNLMNLLYDELSLHVCYHVFFAYQIDKTKAAHGEDGKHSWCLLGNSENNKHQCSVGVVLWDYMNPMQLWLVAWLDTALLCYMNSDPDHSVIDSKTYRGDSPLQSCTTPAPH